MRRIAVRAAGVVSPIGEGLDEFAAALEAGVRGFSKLEMRPLPHDKDAFASLNWPATKGLMTSKALALEALVGIDDAVLQDLTGARTAVIAGTVWGDTQELEQHYDAIISPSSGKGDRAAIRAAFEAYPIGHMTEYLAHHLGVTGPILTISNACASGNVVLGLGHDMIENGTVDHAVCLGVDRFSLTGLWGAERSGFVGRIARPFDRRREGAVLGEGAGIVILSRVEEDDALGPILGWLEGWDVYCEPGAAAITLRDDGLGLKRAMQNACTMAGRTFQEIELVSAHAPGTPLIDRIECVAIAETLAKDKHHPCVNSVKSMTGHLSGASAIVETVACLLQMRGGFVHGNAGLEEPDPILPINVQPSDTVKALCRIALSNACGGGGVNSSVVLAAPAVSASSGAQRPIAQRVMLGSWGALQAPSIEASNSEMPWFQGLDRFGSDTGILHMNRSGQIGAIAAKEAFERAGVSVMRGKDDFCEVAVVSGAWLGGWPHASAALCHGLTKDPVEIFPSTALDNGCHLGALLVAREYGLVGLTTTFCGHLNSGAAAVLRAADLLRAGRQHTALALAYDTNPSFLRSVANAMGGSNEIDTFVDGAAALYLETPNALVTRDGRAKTELVSWQHLGQPLYDDVDVQRLAEMLARNYPQGMDKVQLAGWADPIMENLMYALTKKLGAQAVTVGPVHSAAAEALLAVIGQAEDENVERALVLTGTSSGSKSVLEIGAVKGER